MPKEGIFCSFIFCIFLARPGDISGNFFAHTSLAWRWVPALCADFHGPSMSRRYSGTVAMTASARKVGAKFIYFFKSDGPKSMRSGNAMFRGSW